MNKYLLVMLILFFSGCNNNSDNHVTDDNLNPPPPNITYTIVKVYPHDTSSYTQGLIWHNDELYEGTGLEGFSKLRKINIQNGKAEEEIKLDSAEFGEGITLLNNKIYQLTWRNNKVHVYDANTFKKIKDFNWPYEGWGLTNNGKELIISTGSSNLYFVNADSFRISKIVSVTNNYGPVPAINELEYIHGYIYANQFETDYILKINPETGRVEAQLDCAGLLQKSGMNIDLQQYGVKTGYVLNGIAYDSTKNSLYITGKKWPALFEIKLNE